LMLGREGETLRISLSPSATEVGVTPLALNVALPLTPGPVHVIAKGGPVSLSSLGVRAGQLGLKDVRRATLAADGSADFSEDFETVALDGKLSVHGLSLQRAELSPQIVGPWSFDAALKARARLDGSELVVTSSEAQFGEVRAELSGQITNEPERRHVEGRLRVPLSGCQSMLEAMPNGLLPLVRGMRLSGSFGIDFQVRYDSGAPKETRVVLAVQNECRVQDVPAELSPRRFERPFLREVKGPDGSPMSIESGPGTSSWVSLDDMSRHLESAILICEDSRFHAHAGFDFRALEDAIKDDLKQGRFARGASTVSMQLAKNLYLGKEKTLGRKLQEALLTMLLEQQLDKRRILELYLNVVELGPGLYGVGDAAQYYFATPARSLTLGQSLYLASLLPNPTYSRFGPNGKLSPAWLTYLHRLMQIAHKIKRIDDAELQAGLEEEIAFRVPGAGASLSPSATDGGVPEMPAPPELDDDAP
jgi:penicillin-binding protein 1A